MDVVAESCIALLQRNYWEYILRDEKESERIREHLINNPANWDADEENPQNVKTSP